MTIKIDDITLYKSGVGFFNGICKKREFILPVNEKDVDDVLKSLAVTGLKSVTFSAAEEKNEKQRKIGINIDEDAAFLSFSKHLIGLEVEIEADTNYKGEIVGTDFLITNEVDEEQYGIDVLVIKEEKIISHIPISKIKRLKIIDELIKKDLEVYLKLEAATRKTGVINLNILTEQDEANIQWVAPVSAWRLSYRLQFDEEKSKSNFTGIAIVDNTTSIDWEKIKLNLVTGLPVSFRYDLHSPLYINRPWIARDEQGISPMISQTAYSTDTVDKGYGRGYREGQIRSSSRIRDQPISIDSRKGWDLSRDVIQTKGVSTQEELTAAVIYQITKPVTINQSESSLIPLFTTTMDGELCVIIRDDRIKDSMDAILFKKEIELEKGVASIYINEIYAGDAIVVRGTDYLAFRVNQDIKVLKEIDNESKITSVKISKNLMYQKITETQIAHFRFLNTSDKTMTVILEIMKNEGFIPKIKPDKETINYYRYKINLEAGKSEKIFSFEKLYTTSIYVRDLSEQLVNELIKNEILDNKNERLVLQIFETLRKISLKEKEFSDISNEIVWEHKNQDRIRENIKMLQEILLSEERQKYVERLKKSEKFLEKLEQDKKLLAEEIKRLKTKI
ncbi:MAG: hypothetical protein EAX90_08550 [Candidatus Heimdallarchaeota archaeon]|nr:hypothetical protein [Candidatus Heimdallarchaeota archaeon]